jgi:hypothetical protein
VNYGTIELTGAENTTVRTLDLEEGGSIAGGITGINEGFVQDVYFLHTGDPAGGWSPVLTVGNTAGGIAGHNDRLTNDDGSVILGGVVTRALYIAPIPTAANWGPIVAGGYSASDSYFLHGRRYALEGNTVTPDSGSPPWIRGFYSGYDPEEPDDRGRYSLEFNAILSEDGAQWDAWKAGAGEYNGIYPYPSFIDTAHRTSDDWPLADDSIVFSYDIAAFYYYERYSDNTYGAWNVNSPTELGTLQNRDWFRADDSRRITEAGYAVAVPFSKVREYDGVSLFLSAAGGREINPAAPDGRRFEKSSVTDLLAGAAWAANPVLEADGITAGELWIMKLDLDAMSWYVGASGLTVPMPVHTQRGAGVRTPLTSGGFMQPLFARGLYPGGSTTPPDIRDFRIRTPRQMESISRVTNANNPGTSGAPNGSGVFSWENLIYTQELDLDFAWDGAGVDAGVIHDAVVKDLFFGQYNGGGNEIRKCHSGVGRQYAGRFVQPVRIYRAVARLGA